MNDPELETTIQHALSVRRQAASGAVPSLGGVLDRVDRHRRRRQLVTGVASVALVAVGVAGLAITGDGSPSPDPAGGLDATSQDLVWRCTGELARDPAMPVMYFDDCQQIPRPDVVVAPTTTAVFDQSLPTTTMLAPEPLDDSQSAATTSIAPQPTTTTTFPPGLMGYVIVAGDSAARIAADHGMTVDELAALNSWTDGAEHPIFPGDVVLVRAGDGVSVGEQIYTVVAGDTVGSIAGRFGVPNHQLATYNNWTNADVGLSPGDIVRIPPGAIIPRND